MLHDNRLYMAGSFVTIGNIASTGEKPIAASVAYLDTNSMVWTAVATNGNGAVYDLAIHPVTGRLWAVGGMTLLAPTLTGTGGVGEYVEELGQWKFAGVDPTQFILTSDATPVKALAFDSGGLAIIGGHPSFSAGINTLYGLARLNSLKQWETLGGGVCGGVVHDLAVWNGKLFVGGNFSKVGDFAHDCGAAALDYPAFAVLDLTSLKWSNLGANLTNGEAVYQFQLTNFQARNETSHLSDYLLVAGNFSSLNENAALRQLAKWDGTAWSAPATQIPPTGNDPDTAILAVQTDGFNLYIGGNFQSGSGSGNYSKVAQWDGTQWKNLNGGLLCLASTCTNAEVHTIAPFYTLSSQVVTPLSWGGFDLSKYINWRYWLICLCAVIALALILSILTNCCWKTIGCCKSHCFHSKPREKEVGL